nr:hypothetical protein [Syntrophorhabdus aromaticivorans]
MSTDFKKSMKISVKSYNNLPLFLSILNDLNILGIAQTDIGYMRSRIPLLDQGYHRRSRQSLIKKKIYHAA